MTITSHVTERADLNVANIFVLIGEYTSYCNYLSCSFSASASLLQLHNIKEVVVIKFGQLYKDENCKKSDMRTKTKIKEIILAVRFNYLLF